MRIVIIGAGNVGTNLQNAFAQRGIESELVRAHEVERSEREGDVFIYTVADHVLGKVIACVDAPGALHLHTSGSMPVKVFGSDKPHAGVLYFFQSFSKTHLIEDWSAIPCLIESRKPEDLEVIRTLVQNLTSHVYEADSHDRERLHIAGVFANNYSNLMYRMASDVLQGTHLPFEVLLPLIDTTAAKVHHLTPKEAQTGPAQRGDEEVIRHHLEVLQAKEEGVFTANELKSVYQVLAGLIEKGRNCPVPPTE